jgi:hypothetical protein
VNQFIRVGSNTAPLGNTYLNLRTDNNGRANGYIDIPSSNSTSLFKFTTGTKLVLFNDSPVSPKYSTTYAQTLYSAIGALNNIARASVKGRVVNWDPDVPVCPPPPNVVNVGGDGGGGGGGSETSVTTVFLDSDISVAELADILGLSVTECQARIDVFNSYYENSSGVMDMGDRVDRGTNSLTSLDVGGFCYWSEVLDHYESQGNGLAGLDAIQSSINYIGDAYNDAVANGTGDAYISNSLENANSWADAAGVADEFSSITGDYGGDVADGALSSFDTDAVSSDYY